MAANDSRSNVRGQNARKQRRGEGSQGQAPGTYKCLIDQIAESRGTIDAQRERIRDLETAQKLVRELEVKDDGKVFELPVVGPVTSPWSQAWGVLKNAAIAATAMVGVECVCRAVDMVAGVVVPRCAPACRTATLVTRTILHASIAIGALCSSVHTGVDYRVQCEELPPIPDVELARSVRSIAVPNMRTAHYRVVDAHHRIELLGLALKSADGYLCWPAKMPATRLLVNTALFAELCQAFPLGETDERLLVASMKTCHAVGFTCGFTRGIPYHEQMSSTARYFADWSRERALRMSGF